MSIIEMVSEAIAYAKAYKEKYKIEDDDLLATIYLRHLNYLINETGG